MDCVSKINIPKVGDKVLIKEESYGYFVVAKIHLKSNGVPYRVEVKHTAFGYDDCVYRIRNFKPSSVLIKC